MRMYGYERALMAYSCEEIELHAGIRFDDVDNVLGAEGTEEVVDEILNERVVSDRSSVR